MMPERAIEPIPASVRSLVLDPRFWLLSVGIGVMAGMGAAFVTHAVAIAIQKGISLRAAATLVSSFGIGTVFGGITFGWLADRIGAITSLLINTAFQVVLWLLLAFTVSLPVVLVISALIGTCLGATVALHATAISEFYGTMNISRAMGLSWLVKTPLLLSLAPLTGHLYDVFGSYSYALTVDAGVFAIATVMFGLLVVNSRRSSQLKAVGSAR
jgi:MFS family permease